MSKKYIYIATAALLIVIQSNAQIRPGGSSSTRQGGSQRSTDPDSETPLKENKETNKPKIPSVIKSWEVHEQGSMIQKTEIDTSLIFYHIYEPFNKKSISSTFTGNNGGAYISNNFFKRDFNSDFYFTRSFDAYWLTPSQLKYYNTTTPYSLLDYSQSENRMAKNETRFNVFLSQNVNKKLNFELIYNQTRSQGQYLKQENKFHNIALVSSYNSNNFLSHSNIIFNRLEGQENGGLDTLNTGQLPPLNGTNKTEDFPVRMDDAVNQLQNNNIYTVNEYRLGKTIEADSVKKVLESFIPRVGFIHEFEFSGNKRKFTKTNPNTFFKNTVDKDTLTHDSTQYTRLTNIFQIKFYEAPDRKHTFGKRAYIGHDQLWYNISTTRHYFPEKQSNTFVGGGIFRNEGTFWQWEANGRIYLTGYRAGQTELSGFINKPMKIGKDSPSLRIEGSLKTLVPEYFDRYFYSNHFEWMNNFSNIKEMTIRSSIHSLKYKTTIGANYSLIGNYIYNNLEALPAQAGSELLVVSAYLNKDFENDHWLIRTQLLTQKASNENYIHLPAFAGFISMNYRTIISKVMHFQLGVDARYNTLFYADAYEPATARFYLQNTQKIGNYPYIDLHANLKLKRTRFFFILKNAASRLVGDNFFVAPNYPYYRRTFRIGVAWSFYD
ncbi:MAG: putative porin [Bacteroidota bacterium]|nr:putative porin [Bacteroidota bacterium]